MALDDFGTGFVSIAHLRALGVDIVKIDRSALSGGMGLDGRFGQVGLVAGLARSVGAQVVVEGIEIHEQLQGVQFEDVTHLQGHYFKRAPFARSWRSQNSQMPKRSANSNGER
ncbi:MAG: EAL domain-containing protein [Proteobacteria bacterium]|nr:EAL domain-containing protein [Pseudomonadota bacterium]